jgi:hypothetical protein
MRHQASESKAYGHACMEAPFVDYEFWIKKDTAPTLHTITFPYRVYENGIEIEARYIHFVEIVKFDGRFCIYSTHTERLWCVNSFYSALEILGNELAHCNAEIEKVNAARKLEGETRYLSIPIVLKYSYSEFVEMSFSTDTPHKQAVKYRKALVGAKAKFGENKKITFTVPFFPSKGKIHFEVNTK